MFSDWRDRSRKYPCVTWYVCEERGELNGSALFLLRFWVVRELWSVSILASWWDFLKPVCGLDTKHTNPLGRRVSLFCVFRVQNHDSRSLFFCDWFSLFPNVVINVHMLSSWCWMGVGTAMSVASYFTWWTSERVFSSVIALIHSILVGIQ
jgi:hypothetical protein